MQRKIITLIHCQIVDGEGRSRAMRNARSIGERALAEILIKHQDSHQLRFIIFILFILFDFKFILVRIYGLLSGQEGVNF